MLMMLTFLLFSGVETQLLLGSDTVNSLVHFLLHFLYLAYKYAPVSMIINTSHISCFHLKQLSSFPFSSLLFRAIDDYVALFSTSFTFLQSSQWRPLSISSGFHGFCLALFLSLSWALFSVLCFLCEQHSMKSQLH